MEHVKNLKPLSPTTVNRFLRGHELERQKLIKLHEQRMAEVDAKIRSLQTRCPHNFNDNVCAICGLESRSKSC